MIERDEDWADHTINTFILDSGGITASFVVSRANAPRGVSQQDFAASELHRLSHALPGYKLVHRSGIEIAGRVTTLVEASWTTKQGPVNQLLAYFPLEERLLVLAGTSPAPMAADIRRRILDMMMSFRPVGDLDADA